VIACRRRARQLGSVLAIALSVSALGLPPAALAAPPDGVPAGTPLSFSTERVTPRVFYVVGQSGAASANNQGFMSNAGFVVTPDGVVVFDALGTPALARQLIRRIREHTALPIRKVVVSHFHPDHFYGLAEFKALGAEIWAHKAAADYLASPTSNERLAERRRTLSPWLDELSALVTPDRLIDGETGFEFGGIRFRLIPAGPAHTPEDLVMLVENEGVLFVGDLIFNGRLPFVGTSDSRAWIAAIDRLLSFRPRIIIAGHGRHAANAEETLRFTRDYLTTLRKTMGEAVANFTPFDEAYASTDWSAWSHLPVFAESNRINAYNTYLLMEQESLKSGK
jgi:glyoxylase-like metal-dependent hydrolase (beta-lactamase superfamily II)